MKPLRILAFGAHPDDVEYYCAGTLALLSQAGCEVAIATMTAGQGGSNIYGPDEIAEIRRKESVQASKLIDAEYYCADGMDMNVDFDQSLREQTVDILRQFRPDVVITCGPDDYHPDHEETSRLVRAACFYAPIPNYPNQQLEPIAKVPHLYYMSVERDHFGNEIEHEFIVDTSAVRNLKEKMLRCHASQQEWLEAHHNMNDYLLEMKEKEEYWGRKIGKQAAEAFRQHLGDGYPHDNIIKSILTSV